LNLAKAPGFDHVCILFVVGISVLCTWYNLLAVGLFSCYCQYYECTSIRRFCSQYYIKLHFDGFLCFSTQYVLSW